MTSALNVEDLSVHYGNHNALKPLSFLVQPKELIGIIGPNGAGKTSLTKALCGKVKHEGVVEINGTRVQKRQNRQKLLGLVPQDIGLYSHMSAKENLEVFSQIMGVPRQSRKDAISKAIKAVDLEDKADVLIKDLSGGMKRRINVAAAIMHDPKLIVFDEPTAGVDIPARDALHRLARKLTEQGMAVLLVTHELEQAEALCDKVLVLAQGEKLAFDHPAVILANSFSAAREVVVRYQSPPSDASLAAMKPFKFSQGELPTIWTAMTEASEASFVSAFMGAFQNDHQHIREISVRRPGLTSLMHKIEQTGAIR